MGRPAKVQSLFTSTAAQYLGQISFAIYSLHGPVLQTVGYRSISFIVGWRGHPGPGINFLAAVLSLLLIIRILLGVAHSFERYVDLPAVDFLKNVESKGARKNSVDTVLPSQRVDAEKVENNQTEISISPCAAEVTASLENLSEPISSYISMATLKRVVWFIIPSL